MIICDKKRVMVKEGLFHTLLNSSHFLFHCSKWIANKFPNEMKMAKEVMNEEEGDSTIPLHHILDVAGGKGELSARMTLCHTLRVRMVDPRQADIYDCFQKHVFRSLPKKWQQKIDSQDPSQIQSVIGRRFKQHVKFFPSDGGVNSDGASILSNKNDGSNGVIDELQRDKELLEAVKNCTLIIGMHADGATEAIVEIALHFRKPFIVVPCCVFPNLFRHRLVPMIDDDGKECGGDEAKMVPVRNHEQFCRYLAMKDSNFVVEELPFEGRNIGIWWDGKHKDQDPI